MEQARCRLRVFGVPELLDVEGRPLRFRTRKQLGLLVYLHFEARGRLEPREELVELLWPEVSLSKGRHSLSQALTSIRGHLGSGALECRGGGVRLLVPLVTELELLAEGSEEVGDLADPLEGMELCGGVAFGHWVDRMREGIVRQAREVLVRAVRDARVQGCLERVYRRARLLHRLDPVEPVGVLALAERALVDGDTIGAMRVMKEYLNRVQEELGANPHPEIAALLRRLERGEGPALVFTGRFGTTPRQPREVFVAREREIAQLEALWQQVGERVCQTCLIAGVAGIGKSTLVRRFAMSVAARALPVYVVACQEIGAGIPFAAVADLILALGSDRLAGGTDPRWLAEASRVSPGLRSIYPGVPEPPPAPAESVRIRVADALVAMLESVSDGRPVLLVFDDVHHMDPASRDVLFLVTRRLERVHVVILGTMRAGEGSAAAWADESGTFGWQQRIQLEPLEDRSVSEILDLLSGEDAPLDPEVRERILKLSQGNPYHAELLITDWRQRRSDSLVVVGEGVVGQVTEWVPPETFRSAFLSQYNGVSEHGRHVLHLLACAARAMSPAEIAEVLNLDVAAVELALLGAIERGLLRIQGGRFQFKNELHRAFLYYFIGAQARTFHHTLLANALWRKRHNSEFQWAIEATRHFVRAGMEPEALEAATTGAELAVARGAPREARAVLNLILKAYPQRRDPRVALLLAEALVAEGAYRDALVVLNGQRETDLSPSEKAHKSVLYAECLHRARLSDDPTIVRALGEAITRAETAPSTSLLARALQLQAEVAAEAGDLDTLAQTGSRAAKVANGSTSEECKALATITTGFCSFVRGELRDAATVFRDVAPVLASLSLQADYRRVLNGLGICLTGLGEFANAEIALQDAIAVAEKLGNPATAGNSAANLAWLYLELGKFNWAAAYYRKAMELLALSGSARAGAELFADVSRLAILLGNYRESEEAVQRAGFYADRTGLWQHKVQFLLAQADLFLALGESESAWPLVDEAATVTADRHHLLPNVGQMLRLERHLVLSTRGPAELHDLPSRARTGTLARCTEMMEVELFDEAVSIGLASSPNQLGPVLQKALGMGLLGPIARVLASGTDYPGVGPRLPGESTARLVVRVLTNRPQDDVPAQVGFLEAVAG